MRYTAAALILLQVLLLPTASQGRTTTDPLGARLSCPPLVWPALLGPGRAIETARGSGGDRGTRPPGPGLGGAPDRPRARMMLYGWLGFGLTWVLTAATGIVTSQMGGEPGTLSHCPECGRVGLLMLIPVAGPVIGLVSADFGAGKLVSAILGLGQLAGLTLGIIGTVRYLGDRRRLYGPGRPRPATPRAWVLTPWLGAGKAGGVGLGLARRF